MLTNLAKLEHTIGQNIYNFTCAPNSPLGEVKDALCQFIAYISKIEEAAKVAYAPEAPIAPVEDAPSVVPQETTPIVEPTQLIQE